MAKHKVVILGCTGMLGSMLLDVFYKNTDFEIVATYRDPKTLSLVKKKYPKVIFRKFELLSSNPKSISDLIKDAGWIINAIGITKPYIHEDNPQEIEQAILVNSYFPHLLAQAASKTNSKVIQIATDCVYSGQKGQYLEADYHDALDVYGKTKSLGEVSYGNFLNIRCSIIGPELDGPHFLLEWFLTQPDNAKLTGFTHHKWNGVTTLQFAKLCLAIITLSKFDDLIRVSKTHHFIPNNTVSKFELLNLFAKVFQKKIKVLSVAAPPPPIDRTLSTNYAVISSFFPTTTIEKTLEELKYYMEK